MPARRSNPFIIKNNLASVDGYNSRRQEGSSFWLDDRLMKINLFLSLHKVKIILLTCLLVFLGLWLRLFWLQIINGQQYYAYANGNRIRQQIIPAERGIIYDRYLTPLVNNVAKYALYFVPADLPKEPAQRHVLLAKVASLIGYTPTQLEELYQQFSNKSYQPILITDNLTHQQVVTLKVIEDELAGINLTIEPRRAYLDNSGLAHILGYVGKINQQELEKYKHENYHLNDYIGKDGLELFYEKTLRGRPGIREVEVNAIGKTQKVLNQTKPVMGSNLILSLDLGLQKKITQVLKDTLKRIPSASGAAAIALDPNNGEILALVSLPDYDNNFFSAGISSPAYHNYLTDKRQPLFNRAISGTYPPGSTFKPLVALAALEEGIINSKTTFLSTGGLRIGRWFFPDWKYGGHGRTNVIKAIAESVNTFFYYIGGGYENFKGLGVAKITSFAAKLYFGKTLGIDLPGEASGFLPSREWKERVKQEKWYIGDTYHLAIGQGDILVTPLQLSAYTAAIANGGILYRPHLVKEIRTDLDSSNNLDNQYSYVLNHHFASTDNIEIIRQGMRATILSGSARSLQVLPVAAAGKTGTAQVGANKFHAWFTGFAPYDSPKIVLTILIEHGGEGSSVAVPVFRQVIDWYFNENN